MKQKLEGLAADFQNPFIHISNWVKGEVNCLGALQEAYDEMISIPAQKTQAIDQIKDTEETISRLQSGKFTFGGMLKNEKEKKESVITKQALIAELQVDVGNYDVIKRILIIYLALVAIPSYQKQAKERYIM